MHIRKTRDTSLSSRVRSGSRASNTISALRFTTAVEQQPRVGSHCLEIFIAMRTSFPLLFESSTGDMPDTDTARMHISWP